MSSTLPSTDRMHALDAVRAFALLMGVALHGTLSYLPGAKLWWIVADDPSVALGGLFYWIHLFRMTLFFVVAGFFGRMLLQRLGVAAFVRDRGRRVVAVLLCAWPIVFPAIVVAAVFAVLSNNGGSMPEGPPPPPMTAANFPLTHLWFLYVLAMFYAGALALRALLDFADRGGRVINLVDAGVKLAMSPGGVFALAIPAAIALATTARWTMWFGIPTPDTGLLPNLTAMVSYGFAFGAGWLLQRQPPLLSRIASASWLNLGMAVATSAACLSIVGVVPVMSPATEGTEMMIYAASYAVAGWAWTLALLGLALRFLSGYSPARRTLSDASYWIYLVHLPLVMILQVASSRLGLPWWLEFPALLAVATALMLASYQWFVRHGRIGGWLNGKRVPKPGPSNMQAAHVAG